MGSNNLKDLMEAYNSVYASQQVDEGLGSAVKKLFGGKKKEEAPKPMSRGEQLRKKYKVGPERSDTSAKRQILDRTRAKAERDQKQYGGSVYTKRVADKSKAAHDRYLKGGYSKYGADDRRGSGNKARKRAAALNREEFDIFDAVLEFLQVEGYAETREQAEWMMANVIDEEAIEIILGEEYVDEAQHARENPEKYEREQAKKYAPVRGERTPMPPRGDKRREDFEKWYAKNVR